MIDNITPLGGAVLVELLPFEQIRPSGIILPETEKEIVCRGRVISKGPKAYDELKTGQVVAFCNSPMTRIPTAGQESSNPRVMIDTNDIMYIEEP